jgi:hypothetical protein
MKIYILRAVPLSSRTRMEISSILALLESSLQTCMTYTSAECTVNKLLMMGRSIMVLLESCLQICMTYASAKCTVNKLLKMGRGTARNM